MKNILAISLLSALISSTAFAEYRELDAIVAVVEDDVVLAARPLAHVLGLNVGLLASLRAGATIVFQRRFDADRALDLLERHGVTLLTGAPPMWKRWADRWTTEPDPTNGRMPTF